MTFYTGIEIAHVPWLVDRSVDWFEVTADDVVRPMV
jgi:hypothetical protein